MRHLLSIKNLSKEEIEAIFRLTDELKYKKSDVLRGKNFVLLFSKPSTRTRISFEVAINNLGGNSIYMDASASQASRGETIADTAKTIGRYADGIIMRWHSHGEVVEMAKNAGVPVVNALDDFEHPCQALGDFCTIREKLGNLKNIKLVYLGDGNNNVTHSLMYLSAKLGIQMAVSCPRGFEPDKKVLAETRGSVEVVYNPEEAVKDADIVYTDVWVSMGKEKEAEKRKIDMKPYQINRKIVSLAKPSVLVMHCLPAHRGEEITDEVMDGKNSVVFDQAESRLHVQKGILKFLFG